jgi:predicted glutamine amidotransferase
VKTFFS